MTRQAIHRGVTLDCIVLLAALAALHFALARHNQFIASGGLVDTDSYMRLIRVEALFQSGDWYETKTARLGAPGALSLHWTRPLDLLILLPAMVLMQFGLTAKGAIYWSGSFVSPACQFLACLAAAWAARPLWPEQRAWRVAALMIALNFAVLAYSMVGRPDHHTLSLLFTALSAGAAIRATLSPWLQGPAYLAGALAGAGIWISPEALLTVVPALLAVALLWILAADGREWAAVGRRFGLAMAGVVALAIAIEQPPHAWFGSEYDKVSFLHFLLALLIAFNFHCAGKISWRDWRRPAAALAVGALSVLLLSMLYPGFYLGPMGGIDGRAAKLLLDDVSEMRSAWPDSKESARTFFTFIGNSLVGLPMSVYCLWKWRDDARFAPALLLSFGYAFALAGAVLHVRLALPLAVYGAILGCGLFGLFCGVAEGKHQAVALATKISAAIIVVYGVQVLGIPGEKDKAAAQASLACAPKPVADWLNATRPRKPDKAAGAPIILTESVNFTPELAYRTAYRFVGGPYHRGIADIADMLAVATGTDDAAVRAIVERRAVDFILVCTKRVPKLVGQSDPQSLYHRLIRGQQPDWLRPVPMSAAANAEFSLFEVVR